MWIVRLALRRPYTFVVPARRLWHFMIGAGAGGVTTVALGRVRSG